MREFKKWPLLMYVVKIAVLIAAIILVVNLIPDFRDPNQGEAPSYESVPGENPELESTEMESGGVVPDGDERGNEESLEAGSERADKGKRKPSVSIIHDDIQESLPMETEAIYTPPVMAVASDLHYMSPTMTDFGEAFEWYTEWEDGKVVPYLDQITDAFLEEIVKQKPSVLILSGDISSNGEKVNHGELARKLRRVQRDGVPVVVIPGNHDINHPDAATYYGSETVPSEAVDAEGFLEIYHEFGYDRAVSRDEDSLSYVYQVDERYWLMMLDSCIYDPENEVGGRIKRSTLTWMEQWLEKAKEEQITVVPVAHHNLLNESVLYQEDCTLKNNREVIRLLESYGVPVYISGHLHLQRVKKNINSPAEGEKYGIHEIVSNSLSISPCQYGILKWSEDGSMDYHTKSVDVEAWAQSRGSLDENLLNFAEYSRAFLVDTIAEQTYRSLHSIPEERKNAMAQLYGSLNSTYCAGKKIRPSDIKSDEIYFFWERYMGNTKWFDKLTAMLRDTGHDHNALKLQAGVDFPAVDYQAAKDSVSDAGSDIGEHKNIDEK